MVRIRGKVGDWPVDLTLELDAQEWTLLAEKVQVEPAAVASKVAPSASAEDGRWQMAQDLLRQAQQMDGPQLLADLSALAGSAQAGKRLLVRLRHCEQVKLENGGETPIYRWIER
ncbi:hypothetical protein NA655_10075 [Pseudomonas kuykendallii]|uniref:Uncharacterized protein n=1 Tax=Pseudomonas kuykendallii TaxID=1007099 RepID=A0A1H2UZC9_9PSED|nr:hypothetical protein [Pseudomonas kuykendallii]MCQ4271367.1 hypothetical protein [Pseudomonas kuykendallii]SDW61433.1 hypothetical protein SAMN05216287_1067 [Pseudomonas kuykendallii]